MHPSLHPPASASSDHDALSICIVNNMPGPVLEKTERQFRELMERAAGERRVTLQFFSLPDHRRRGTALDYIRHRYGDLNDLLNTQCDGLIVTGTEPRADRLTQEPFWPSLAGLIDWAEDHTSSAVWLCLAAHAAVLHMDGIERHQLPQKLFGLFTCEKVRDHWLLAHCPERWIAPHSRSNDLDETDLVAKGYTVLSRSASVGSDVFVRQSRGRSHFVYLQGHLEYDADALLEEYRREVGRFLSGRRVSYPDLPSDYFTESTERLYHAARRDLINAKGSRGIEALPRHPEIRSPSAWQPVATQIFANWIADLTRRKRTLSRVGTSARDAMAMFE